MFRFHFWQPTVYSFEKAQYPYEDKSVVEKQVVFDLFRERLQGAGRFMILRGPRLLNWIMRSLNENGQEVPIYMEYIMLQHDASLLRNAEGNVLPVKRLLNSVTQNVSRQS